MVKSWVEDGHLKPHGSSTGQGCLQGDMQLPPREAIGQSVVDSGHEGVVERVGVKMNPESVQPRTRETVDRLACRGVDA